MKTAVSLGRSLFWEVPICALKRTIPVFFSHFPLGLVFGLACTDVGLEWYWAAAMSLLVYGGSIQFMALGVFAYGGTWAELVAMTILLSFRNSIYGLSFLRRFPRNFWRRFYMIWGLVDSTFGILVCERDWGKDDERFCWWVRTLNQVYWVTGTLAGSCLGLFVQIPEGLEFSLTALFVTLTLEQMKSKEGKEAVIVASLASIFACFLWPEQLLGIALGLSVLIFALRGRKS